ncbi:pilus assembly/adherence protein PilC [Neisseria gonorrhoeae]|nr:pilus assembly/adherence protein PilC [Neisseria gonorrhoeae]
MFSHTGGGGAMAQTSNYAIVMNERKQPEVKWEGQYNQSALKDKGRERTFSHTSQKNALGITSNFISFNNNDELVSQQSGTAVFGTATYLPPYGKVSGFDTAELNKRGNAVNWIRTTRPGLAGYAYTGIHCGHARDCPKLTYKTRFSFDNPDLVKNAGSLDRHTESSRDNSPIYKLKDYPWLGVSFNLGAEGTAKDGRSSSKLVSSFNEKNSNNNLVYTTEGRDISLGNWQSESTAVAYYLNAKLHLLDKKRIKDITGKTVQLGVLKPSIDVKTQNTGFAGILNFWSKWDIKDNGQIPVKLDLPEVKAGRCTNTAHPNKTAQALSPALTAPALWFVPVQNGKVQMYSASVSTYPGSSSSRIFLQELKTKTDPGRPGRHSLAALNTRDIKSREPNFNSRQTVIRLPGGVYKISSGKNGGRVAGFNGNDGKNDTFGIYKDRLVTPEADEWSNILLPWTARYYGNDDIFKTFNQPNNKKQSDKKQYSQKYRIRTKEDDNDKPRDLGDIVNSPITAVGGYLATSANDGMVHIFKKTGTDQRGYELKLSYIPGTMERKDIEGNDSDLAKELRAFAEQGYVGDRYGVDGGFVLRRITDDQDKQKHFFMFGAMGLGGRGAYALDLSKIDGNYPAAAPLFDVKNGDNNGKNRVKVELGYTVGTPQIGKTQNGKYAAFLASGYAAKDIGSGDNTTALYVYDLENGSGSLIKKIEAPGGKGGLSSPTLVDKDLDGTVDIAYAGDRGGNMYRFDLSDSDPNKWSAKAIFEGTKPITSAPAVSRLADKRVVIFGTGSDLSEQDVVGTDQQYIYGIFDDDKPTVNVKVTNGTGGGLLEQVLSEENKILFLINNKASGGSADKGWVVKLREGERVTVKPTVVLRTAFVTIRKYTGNDKCDAQTAILGINTADGGALTPRSARPIVPDNQVAQYSGHQKMNGKSVPIGCMWKNGKTVCPNGYVYDKPVNVRYLDEKKTDDFPVTADGDAGGSGTFKEGKKPARNNRCFSGKGVRTLLMNDLDSLDITGPMCGIKRLSWREVFF